VAAGPTSTWLSPGGTSPASAIAASSRPWQASAVSGVRDDGFQITASPHTSASVAFQAHTAPEN
jgi:hypothetical protein